MKVKKLADKYDPLSSVDGADYLTKQLSTPPVDNSGTIKANQAIADAQTAANNLQQNFSTDLSTDNLTNVQAGATATDSADSMTSTLKRKKSGSGLSSALGIGG